jgi:hypothetical protein
VEFVTAKFSRLPLHRNDAPKRASDHAWPRDEPDDVDDPFAVFVEWASAADEKAYSRL